MVPNWFKWIPQGFLQGSGMDQICIPWPFSGPLIGLSLTGKWDHKGSLPEGLGLDNWLWVLTTACWLQHDDHKDDFKLMNSNLF